MIKNVFPEEMGFILEGWEAAMEQAAIGNGDREHCENSHEPNEGLCLSLEL